MNSRRRVTAALIGLLALVVGAWIGQQALSGPQAGGHSVTGHSVVSEADLPWRGLSQLPPQAAETWQRIQAGGPLRYPQDGWAFPNDDGVLPTRQEGFYQEYTVPTPGRPDRGDRRLVIGQGGDLYYSGDLYASVVAVDPTR